MSNTKLRKIGNSTDITLPKEVLEKLNLSEGDTLNIVLTSDGIKLTPYDPNFDKAMELFKKNASRFRNAMRALADG